MSPVSIIANGANLNLGGALPSHITSLVVDIKTSIIPIRIPKQQSILIRKWLKALIEALKCDYITYNGILIRVEDIRR